MKFILIHPILQCINVRSVYYDTEDTNESYGRIKVWPIGTVGKVMRYDACYFIPEGKTEGFEVSSRNGDYIPYLPLYCALWGIH